MKIFSLIASAVIILLTSHVFAQNSSDKRYFYLPVNVTWPQSQIPGAWSPKGECLVLDQLEIVEKGVYKWTKDSDLKCGPRLLVRLADAICYEFTGGGALLRTATNWECIGETPQPAVDGTCKQTAVIFPGYSKHVTLTLPKEMCP
ncbi:MAG: hypothetical protein AB7G93_19170 [Bdellovibrionales bacterium]